METTMMRRAGLGALSLSFLLSLAGGLAALGMAAGGANPPANPAIVFTEKTSKNSLLRVMNADGSNVQTVVTGGKWDTILQPSWSPDGSRLAFLGVLGGVQGLWVVNLNGTGRTRIASFTVNSMESAEWSPAATPDGRDKIVFTIYDQGANTYGVCVINPDGTGLQTLASGVDAYHVAWNHYADALLVVKADTDSGALYLQHLAALGGGGLTLTGETRLDPPTEQIDEPSAANTGDRVVYFSWPSSGSPGLEVLDLGVSPPAAVQITYRDDYWPSFSPDDARLAYARRSASTGRYNIYTSLADGTGEALIRSSTNNTSLMYPNWRHN